MQMWTASGMWRKRSISEIWEGSCTSYTRALSPPINLPNPGAVRKGDTLIAWGNAELRFCADETFPHNSTPLTLCRQRMASPLHGATWSMNVCMGKAEGGARRTSLMKTTCELGCF